MEQPVNDDGFSGSNTDIPVKPEPQVKSEPGVKIKAGLDQEIPFIPKTRSKFELNGKPRRSGIATDTQARISTKFPELGPPLINDERIQVRVAQKEEIVEFGLHYLKGQITIMEKYVNYLPECREWLKQLNTVTAQAAMPRVLVGLLGQTGAGKSSMVNALIDEEYLVPCNAMRASTAVPVEIAYNVSSNPAELYRAEIEFVTEEEWAAEFKVLTEDVRIYHEYDDHESREQSLYKVSAAKLSAAYHGAKVEELIELTSEQLSNKRDLSKLLSKTEIVIGKESRSFSDDISRFIDSSNKGSKDEPAFWPLIRSVRVYTKCPLLKDGLVLVDLPGLGDQNEARRRVTESYIRNLHHMWIVADIVRAVDSEIAKNLMGDSFKRQLLMDGRYHDNFVTFIMTKTDDITPENVIKSLKLDQTVLLGEFKKLQKQRLSRDAITEEIETLEQQERDIRKALVPINKALKDMKKLEEGNEKSTAKTQKRKFEDFEAPESKNSTNFVESDEETELHQKREDLLARRRAGNKNKPKLEQKRTTVNKAIEAVYTVMKTVSIEERNRWAQHKVQVGFEGGFNEFRQEMAVAESGNTNQSLNAVSQRNLKTFAISTKAYQQLCGRSRNENSLEGFPNVDATQIPALREHAIRSTLPERERIASKAMKAMHLFNIRLRVWAENKDAGELSDDQKQLLSDEVNKHFAPMVERCRSALEIAFASITNHRKKVIDLGLQDALPVSLKRAKKTCELIALRRLPVGTFKAVCVRNGTWIKKGGAEYKWTDAFAKAIEKPLTGPWDAHVNKYLDQVHQVYKRTLIEELQLFLTDLENSFSKICIPAYKPLEGVLSQIRPLQEQVKESVDASFHFAQRQSKDISREIRPIIVANMQPMYQQCKMDRGKGVGKRLIKLLEDHVLQHGPAMYQDCAKMISGRLNDMTIMIASRLADAASDAYSELIEDLNLVINDPDAQRSGARASEKRIELQKAVLDSLNHLMHFWGTVGKEPVVQSRLLTKVNFEAASDEEEDDDNSEADSQEEDSDSGSESPHTNIASDSEDEAS